MCVYMMLVALSMCLWVGAGIVWGILCSNDRNTFSSSVGMSIEWLTGVTQVVGSRPDVFSCELKILDLYNWFWHKRANARVTALCQCLISHERLGNSQTISAKSNAKRKYVFWVRSLSNPWLRIQRVDKSVSPEPRQFPILVVDSSLSIGFLKATHQHQDFSWKSYTYPN